MEQQTEQISYKLETFEGPLDLLLSLLAKNKLNIFDINLTLLCEQYIQHICCQSNVHCIFGYAYSLRKTPYCKEHNERNEGKEHYTVVRFCIYKNIRILTHKFHKWDYRKHYCQYSQADKYVQYKTVLEVTCCFFIVSTAIVLPCEWNKSLGKADTENHSHNKNIVWEWDAGKLCGTQVAYHNVVCHLNNHLSGLRDHNRNGKIYIAFVKWYILFEIEHFLLVFAAISFYRCFVSFEDAKILQSLNHL